MIHLYYSTDNSRLINSQNPPIHTNYKAYPPFSKVLRFYLEKLTMPCAERNFMKHGGIRRNSRIYKWVISRCIGDYIENWMDQQFPSSLPKNEFIVDAIENWTNQQFPLLSAQKWFIGAETLNLPISKQQEVWQLVTIGYLNIYPKQSIRFNYLKYWLL